MTKKIVVSIIIVHYKVPEQLFTCLTSIITAKSKVPFEIIIVDNDEKPIIEKELNKKFPQIQYISNSQNTGYGAGNNLGAANAKGEYLFFLNPDTEIYTNTIEQLVNFLETHPKVGIAAPLLLNPQGKPYELQGTTTLTPWKAIFSMSFISKLFPTNQIRQSYWLQQWNKKTNQSLDVVPGTAFLISKKLFTTIHGFDEKFFLYFEETDLCKRIRDAGYQIFMIPSAQVMHTWGESTKKSEKNINEIFTKSRRYYFTKHFGSLIGSLTNMLLSISKTDLLFFLILILGGFLRLYKLPENFFFDGEIGDNLLDIKNALVHHTIPLIGPPTSHPWLHFGPLYYWMYGIVLLFAKYNPLSYSYFGAVVSIMTIIVNYLFVQKIFNKTTAFIASFLMSFAYIFLLLAHTARFFSLVPLLTYPFLWMLYMIGQRKTKYIFFLGFLLGCLLNFHYTPLVFFPLIITICIWRKIRLNFIDYIQGIIGFVIPLIPLFIYDSQHRFTMTIDFLLWIPYKVATFLHVYHKPEVIQSVPPSNLLHVTDFFASFINYHMYSFIAMVIAFITIGYSLTRLVISRNTYSYVFILLWGFWGLIGVLVIGSPPEHYYSPILAFPLIMFSLLLTDLWNISKKGKSITIITLLGLFVLAAKWLFSTDWFYNYQINQHTYADTQKIAKKIIADSHNEPYMLKRVGYNDRYEKMYAQHYMYLLWLYGNEPVLHAKRQYIIYDDSAQQPTSVSAKEALFTITPSLVIIRKDL